MSRILITGANGLTGRHLAASLRARHEVVALVHSPPTEPLQDVDYRVIDLSAPWDSLALPERMDAVVHLAQPSDLGGFPTSAVPAYWVNTGSVVTLLDYAQRAGARKFLHVSTGGLYGSSSEAFLETAPIRLTPGPLEHYFRTKLCTEILVQAYQATFEVTIVRPFFIYGPSPTKTRLIQRMIHAVKSLAPVRIVGAQGTSMNPVHVDDVVAGLTVVLESAAPSVVNFAGPQVVSVRDIATLIGAALNLTPSFIETPGEPDRFVADIRLFQSLVHRPLLPFDVGIRKLLADMHDGHV
jgi:UDP-glucose 4-epimerase